MSPPDAKSCPNLEAVFTGSPQWTSVSYKRSSECNTAKHRGPERGSRVWQVAGVWQVGSGWGVVSGE